MRFFFLISVYAKLVHRKGDRVLFIFVQHEKPYEPWPSKLTTLPIMHLASIFFTPKQKNMNFVTSISVLYSLRNLKTVVN